jgi:carbon-monoxide dehydrogenase large subunit
VRWIASRSEALQSDTHARDVASDAELAMSADGRFLALRTRHDVNLGAYISFAAPHVATHGLAMARTGLYDIPCSTIEVTGHLTNTPWTDAYRGAGKPESILLLERLVDEAARCLGMDRAELRRRNLIVPASLPYRTVSGETYDSGDFIFCLERAVERSGWREADRRASAAQARGRHFGIGLSSWLDVTSAGPIDQAWLRLDTHGRFTAGVGSQDTGQGHLAGFSAIIARRLGISVALSDLAQGDSDTASQGGATYGAKTMGVAGAAVAAAADALLDAARHRAAAIFDVSLEMVDYEAGILAVPDTNHRISLTELAAIEDLAGEGSGGGLPTYPNGCHVCAVEIDAGTGKVELVGYTAIDDFGPILDRPALEGQVAGGIAQGLGQALMERVAFDDFGQLLTGSLMDYALPRATDLVPIGLTLCEDCPCTTNPAGAKGSGQSGTIGALAAAMNAINDAIWRAGRKPIDPPATPNRVWTALS